MKQIYKYLFAAGVVYGAVASAAVQGVVTTNGVMVRDITLVPHDGRMNVDMLFDVSDLRLRSNYSLQITPILSNGQEMVQLPPVVIDGRRRSIVHQRHESEMYESINTYVRRYNNKDQVVEYDADVPMESWMEGSELVLREEWCSCHDLPISEELMAVAQVPKSTPVPVQTDLQPTTTPSAIMSLPRMAYAMPKSEDKSVSQGDMDIYFAVNKSDIVTSFMDNSAEIKDIVAAAEQSGVKQIHLMGYASPEGPYEFNKALAARRAEAVKSFFEVTA